MRSLLFAAIIAATALGAGAPPGQAKVQHACPITRTCHRCPKGEWLCDGKCIPKREACEIR
jgi:hypothetical protein